MKLNKNKKIFFFSEFREIYLFYKIPANENKCQQKKYYFHFKYIFKTSSIKLFLFCIF